MKSPMFAKCCGQVVGCQDCVERWLNKHVTCPHCSSVQEDFFPLKGFEDVLTCVQLTVDEKSLNPIGYHSISSSELSSP